MINFDELHALTEALLKVEDTEGVIKTVRNLLKGAYEQAVLEMEDEFDFLFLYEPDMEKALNLEIEGKDWETRIRDHIKASDLANGGDNPPVGEVTRVVDTEYHRMYNTGAYDSAKALESKGKTVMKRWVTMEDNRVRDTHRYISGESVPLDEEFYTFDGDSALYPGGFTKAQNNCGCRCSLSYEVV